MAGRKGQPYSIIPRYLKLYNYHGRAKRKDMMCWRIPSHYTRAERSHMGMSFRSHRNHSAASTVSLWDKATAWWGWLGRRSHRVPLCSLPLAVSTTHCLVLGVPMGAQQGCYDSKQDPPHLYSQEESSLVEELTVCTVSTRSGVGHWEKWPKYEVTDNLPR